MKKRIRKKRHLKEYKSIGYSFECEWTNPVPDIFSADDKYDKEYTGFWDKLDDWCFPRNFCFGGGSNNKTIGWILQEWKSESQKCQTNPTREERNELIEWIKQQPEIKSIKVTDELNLWNSDGNGFDNYTFKWNR